MSDRDCDLVAAHTFVLKLNEAIAQAPKPLRVGSMQLGVVDMTASYPSSFPGRNSRCAAAIAGAMLIGQVLICGPAWAAPIARGPFGAVLVPRNVSYWEMVDNATMIVKMVMIMLLIASVATWAIWLSKLLELASAKQRLGADIHALSKVVASDQAGSMSHEAPVEMLSIARAEIARAGRVRTPAAAEGLKDRVAARLFNVESTAIEKMMRGTNVLATVGATAPFIGLFGTVWGIMNSFIGISRSHITSLAVVAPGIAEALLATAMGLVAAIPAVIMYNHIARAIAGFRRQLSEAAINVACLLSHDVDVQLGRDTITQAAA